MSLFDTKEEVISIELTPYGRKCLNEKNFKPKYYTFHDDEVNYDSEYLGFEENNNEIFDRIAVNMISLKPQTRYEPITGGKTRFSNILGEKQFAGLPVGTSKINNVFYPAWDLSLKKGEISNTNQLILTGSSLNIKLPQINLKEINCEWSEEDSGVMIGIDKFSTTIDNKEIVIQNNDFLISLEELNVDDIIENFEFELFELDNEDKIVKQILFTKSINNIINDIYYDDSELPATAIPNDILTANKLFNIFIDDKVIFTTPDQFSITNTNDQINLPPYGRNC